MDLNHPMIKEHTEREVDGLKRDAKHHNRDKAATARLMLMLHEHGGRYTFNQWLSEEMNNHGPMTNGRFISPPAHAFATVMSELILCADLPRDERRMMILCFLKELSARIISIENGWVKTECISVDAVTGEARHGTMEGFRHEADMAAKDRKKG